MIGSSCERGGFWYRTGFAGNNGLSWLGLLPKATTGFGASPVEPSDEDCGAKEDPTALLCVGRSSSEGVIVSSVSIHLGCHDV